MGTKLYDAYGREIRRTAGFISIWQHDLSCNIDGTCDSIGFWQDEESIETEDYCKEKDNKRKHQK